MNKEIFNKLKADQKAKPKVKRDPFAFLRLWLGAKPVTKTKHVLIGTSLGNKKLFGNVVLLMTRRSLSMNRTPLTESKKQKEADKEFRSRFTRREWNQALTSARCEKNKDNGLNRYGHPVYQAIS